MSSVPGSLSVKGVVLFLVLLQAACGGGGSGGTAASPKAGTLVDPAPSYSGVMTQAQVTQGNALNLALGGFGGDVIGSSLAPFSVAGTSVAAANQVRVQELAQVMKQAVRRMDIPGKANQRRQARQASGLARVQRVESYQVPGDAGGYVAYSLDINDAAGSFFGTLDFHAFTSQGVTVSGSASLLGTFEANRQEFNRITLTFNSLSMAATNASYTLIGSLSWGFNFGAASETLSINMVLVDGKDGRTYWFKDYSLYSVYSGPSLTQNLSGRYYDPAYGYLDFASQAPLVLMSGDSWPSRGALLFSGKQGTWSRLSFQTTSLLVEADTDGNGSADWQTERATNSGPKVNAPPVADAGPDQSVTQMSQVLLNGAASHDPDGDTLGYSWTFSSCPQNSCPGLTGANTATPSFSAQLAGSYQLQLSVYDGQSYSQPDSVTVTSTTQPPSTPGLLKEQWQYGSFGTSIGRAGLLLRDLDGDGTPEIIASASGGGFGDNTFWYVARRTADGKYEQLWRSEPYAATIISLSLADLTGSGKEAIVVGLSDGTVLSYDSATRAQLSKITVAAPLAAMAIADLDGDGSKELVTSNGIGVNVYAAATGALKWSLTTGGGSSLAVGNVDSDPALEIVTTSYGGKGYVIDGVSHAVEWEYANSFGAQVKLGELQGDGRQQIVGAAAWYKITIFDANRKTPVWEIATDLDIDAVLVADADGDGVPEIIYGDRQMGGLHAIGAVTHTKMWSISNWDGGISSIAVGDVDLDGKKEVLWGSGGNSTGADHLYLADPLTGTVKWQSVDINGPWCAVAVGDLDDDGEDEVVMVSGGSDSGYGEGVIFIFNARTHALKFQQKLGIMDWMGVRTVQIGDVDGDGKTEFVLTTANVYDGLIRVYDGTTHALKTQSAGYSGNYFTALALGDVDGDGKMEIVAGQGREHTGAAGVYLVVFDGATLQEKWRSVDVGSYWGGIYDIKLADLDGDGHQEIIASVPGVGLLVYDGVNHDLKAMISLPCRALALADVDGDGAREILVGRDDGKIDVLNGKTFAVKRTVNSFSSDPIDALRVADLSGPGSGDWLVTAGGRLTVLGGVGQELKWKSDDLSRSLGLYDHLEVRDTDRNGRMDVFLGSAQALYHFE